MAKTSVLAHSTNPFPHVPQFRETPLPPPTTPKKRKRLPLPISKEEKLELIAEARKSIDEADRIVGCMARQAYELRGAIGRDASLFGEHIIIALQAMSASGCEQLKAARAKLNTLETIELYGSHIAPVRS